MATSEARRHSKQNKPVTVQRTGNALPGGKDVVNEAPERPFIDHQIAPNSTESLSARDQSAGNCIVSGQDFSVRTF
jgi:hypothetical protein